MVAIDQSTRLTGKYYKIEMSSRLFTCRVEKALIGRVYPCTLFFIFFMMGMKTENMIRGMRFA